MMQEELERQSESITIQGLLGDQMDRVDRRRRRRTLKERLGLNGIGCCGATWGIGPTTMSVRDDDEQEQLDIIILGRTPDPECPGITPSGQGPSMGMNLAAALAAERHFRESHEQEANLVGPIINNNSSGTGGTVGTVPGTPPKVSLMRLLEETDGCDDGEEKVKAVGSDTVCCVCIERKKGAAFIPCGHTFCRVCSRELWLNRGSCPLCNRSILEILDIF